MSGEALLRVENLKTHFFTDVGVAKAVDGVSFELEAGKTLALVGESGCGKSVTALSVMRLVAEPPGRIVEGRVLFDGKDLVKATPADMQAIRGNDISMIFQEPMTSLNPVFRVGSQIASAIRLHRGTTKTEARREAVSLLEQVGIPDPESRVDDYPHQMSGGMRQRAMIAMALACDPKLLIADEPTTALDVTIQAQILDLLKKLQEQRGMAMLLITHDLGVVAETADDVAIMYAGRVCEEASTRELFKQRAHPYTRGLFGSLPDVTRDLERLETIRGQVPAATQFPDGCRFHPRCDYAIARCATTDPPEAGSTADHCVRCWLYDEKAMEEEGRPVGIPEGART